MLNTCLHQPVPLTFRKYAHSISDRMLKALRVCLIQNEPIVNLDKIEAILFKRESSTVNLKDMLFNGSQIKMASEIKYLGVILDSILNWNIG